MSECLIRSNIFQSLETMTVNALSHMPKENERRIRKREDE